MSKMAGIEFLKEQLIAVERERKELQEALAKLPQLDLEAQAIKLLLAKHGGEKHKLSLPFPVSKWSNEQKLQGVHLVDHQGALFREANAGIRYGGRPAR